tara:strand:- start:102 stop:338 length:237 start_codon:yes stop_codon:yes gene_type:complete
MKLGFADICLNCTNLSESFRCSLHNTEVEINNFCDDHSHNTNLNKDSSCLNCASFQKSDCSFTDRSGEGMLCFDWKKV